jgi:hypothetical protein
MNQLTNFSIEQFSDDRYLKYYFDQFHRFVFNRFEQLKQELNYRLSLDNESARNFFLIHGELNEFLTQLRSQFAADIGLFSRDNFLSEDKLIAYNNFVITTESMKHYAISEIENYFLEYKKAVFTNFTKAPNGNTDKIRVIVL